MLDLFAGRLGWSKAFLARGWTVTAVDMVKPVDIPDGVDFIQAKIEDIGWVPRLGGFGVYEGEYKFGDWRGIGRFDFVCASPPCEQFSVHGLKCFHKNPPYPEYGIDLFNHTRHMCELSAAPWVIENVRSAQQFVGNAVHHCGPFYLWGSGVPPILPQGIRKGIDTGGSVSNRGLSREEIKEYRRRHDPMWSNSQSEKRKIATAQAATIPPELSSCVADYADRLYREESA